MTARAAWLYCPAKVAGLRGFESEHHDRTRHGPSLVPAPRPWQPRSTMRWLRIDAPSRCLLCSRCWPSCRAFSRSRRSTATRRASRRPPSRCWKRGEYVDIRFQDEVRYKKPVGIYWLQAAAVKAGEALGVPQARTTIWLYRLPSLFGAIGAVLLTYWAALAFVSRRARAARGADDGKLGPARRRGASRQDRRHAFADLGRGDGRDGAHLSRQPAHARAAGRLDTAGDPLDRAGRRHAAQGAADPDVRRAYGSHAVGRRSLGALAVVAASRRRLRLAGPAGPAVVRRDRCQIGRQLSSCRRSATTCSAR